MPTKRRRVPRIAKAPLSAAALRFFESGEYLNLEALKLAGQLSRGDAKLAALWAEHRERVLTGWMGRHPGTRPFLWWELDAPKWRLDDMPERLRRADAFWRWRFCEPRRRIGGTGTPTYEALNCVPHFAFGVPTCWVTDFDVAYYNGRARNIHGDPIGTEYAEGRFPWHALNPSDPPRFETEAAYLERHGLLTAAERRVLSLTARRASAPSGSEVA